MRDSANRWGFKQDSTGKFISASLHDADRAAKFLRAHPEILKDRRSTGESVLHWLVVENRIASVRLILAAGADLSRDKDEYGVTPLHSAASLGLLEMAQLLLDHGASPASQNRSGETPLHFAARNGSKAAVEFLLSVGAELEAKSDLTLTPLHEAAMAGNLETALALVQSGADPEIRDGFGCTVLMQLQDDSPELVRMLLEYGASLDARDCKGSSVLHHFAFHGALRVIRLLLEKGLDPTVKNNEGSTPLGEIRRRLEVPWFPESGDRERYEEVLQLMEELSDQSRP